MVSELVDTNFCKFDGYFIYFTANPDRVEVDAL